MSSKVRSTAAAKMKSPEKTTSKPTTTTASPLTTSSRTNAAAEVSMDNLLSGLNKIKIVDANGVASSDVPDVVEPDVVASTVVPKIETEVIDWEKESQGLDQMFEEQANSKLVNLPKLHKIKDFRSSVKLFQYQKDGIRWLVSQERDAKPSPFLYEKTLKDGTVAYYCKLSKHRVPDPEPLHGSILADGRYTVVTHASFLSVSNRISQTIPFSPSGLFFYFFPCCRDGSGKDNHGPWSPAGQPAFGRRRGFYHVDCLSQVGHFQLGPSNCGARQTRCPQNRDLRR